MFDTLTISADKDTIKDFTVGEDVFQISRAVFTAFADRVPGQLVPGDLGYGAKAATPDEHIIYNTATGALYYDPDGVGGVDQIQIARLANQALVSAADFILT